MPAGNCEVRLIAPLSRRLDAVLHEVAAASPAGARELERITVVKSIKRLSLPAWIERLSAIADEPYSSVSEIEMSN